VPWRGGRSLSSFRCFTNTADGQVGGPLTVGALLNDGVMRGSTDSCLTSWRTSSRR
jgi:hypothetical protein